MVLMCLLVEKSVHQVLLWRAYEFIFLGKQVHIFIQMDQGNFGSVLVLRI